MLGILHEQNMAASLHSSDYFPLRTKAPIIVLRDMVVSDLMFLDPDHYGVSKKIVFLQSFIESFKGRRGTFAANQIRQATTHLRKYQFQLWSWRIGIAGLLLAFLFLLFLLF